MNSTVRRVAVAVGLLAFLFAAELLAQKRGPSGLQLSGAKEIEGIDVIIKRKPPTRGAVPVRTQGAKTLDVMIAPGSHTIVISFDDPLPQLANAKTFNESRSNAVRVTQRNDLPKPPNSDWLAFDKWPYLYALGGSGITRKGAIISRAGNRVTIEQEVEISGKTDARVQIVVRRLPAPAAGVAAQQ